MTLFSSFMRLVALDHPVIRSNQALGIVFAPLWDLSFSWNLLS
jgi:hypothetical protein